MILFLISLTLIIAFLIFIHTRPDDFTIERSVILAAPAEKIFPHLNNLQNWNAWSPWARLDPNAKNTFSDAIEGVGASMHWVGNSKVGEGHMTITKNEPHTLVEMDLKFIKPMQANNVARFTLTPTAQGTHLTWSMSGTNSFLGKLIGFILNCDKMVGTQFEKGLSNLKSIIE